MASLTSLLGIDARSPSVAHTTARLGPRPVANALGCGLGEMAIVGIGRFARRARSATMS